MNADLRGRKVLLTGASRGLGVHIARALARCGADLALTARAAEPLENTAAEVRDLGVHAVALPADVSDSAARSRLLADAEVAIGPLDILVNNAGLERVSRYTALPLEDIENMVRTNLEAPLALARLALPGMIERGRGHVVMMSSLGGKKGSPYSATYAATKAGLIAWNSGMREELRGTGVSTSVICPGFVSEAGMFAVYGKRAPRIAGETTPAKVADAVVRAIRRDVGEIVVNPGPMRLMAILDALHPAIVTWILRHFGVYDFYRRQAEENQARSPSPVPGSAPTTEAREP
jgi:short-subunit dehydrogenase